MADPAPHEECGGVHAVRPNRSRESAAVAVLGTGSYLPDRVVTNTEAGVHAGVGDAWIVRKTAIRHRRWAHPEQATSDLATAAARRALDSAGIDAAELSVIVVATSTPDRPQPPTAAYVQHRLGARYAGAFDTNAVCSGFVFALAAAESMLARSGGYGLVIGADIYSRILDPGDRKTVILFGDGAGAVVLGPATGGRGVSGSALHTFGELGDLICVPAGGSREPGAPAAWDSGRHYFTMNGRAVREFVVRNLPRLVKQFLHDSAVGPSDIAHLVPHQANGVLLDDLIAELDLPEAVVHRTLVDYGNTGAASIPITLDVAARRGALNPGELVLLAGFGGGMSVGLSLLRW
ncbi:3-oxoacyl-ACP synthase III family protein [Nocardia mexicana]|uniref:3-oxoacyl-[acyl-carrier-protein] synthase-3 n=1 Tax=Nocardia mexicana TaxID=279262 RepID=A0A370H208_9NOCA|nr:beta-ketoacyl-ACP synthase 3 [Nocardia mexicana]RDI49993.1 3-oxoacyl-[acyl-carrier-protein] synthase-3 [Nocardia mexicana]